MGTARRQKLAESAPDATGAADDGDVQVL
jgi:hypothetical protein